MLVCKLAPTVTRHCKYWYSNDGDRLTAQKAKQLATALEAELASGRIAALIALRVARLRRLPNVTCQFCAGAGVRSDGVGTGSCNGCAGRGSTRPSEANYFLNEADVRDFAAFLKVSGGFRIC